MISRFTIGSIVVAIFSGLGAYTATVATKSASQPATAATDNPTDSLVSWLGASDAQRTQLIEHDPTFSGDLKQLQAELAAKRSELAAILERAAASNEDIMAGVEASIAAGAALERRIAKYLLTVRDHLTPEQQRRLFNLCAEEIRQGCRCRRGQQLDLGGNGTGGQTGEHRGGRGPYGRGFGGGRGQGAGR